jgi:hypothetical protein
MIGRFGQAAGLNELQALLARETGFRPLLRFSGSSPARNWSQVLTKK